MAISFRVLQNYKLCVDIEYSYRQNLNHMLVLPNYYNNKVMSFKNRKQAVGHFVFCLSRITVVTKHNNITY